MSGGAPVEPSRTEAEHRIVPLLERLTIALAAVLLVAALAGVLKYDMERTAASTPAARARF